MANDITAPHCWVLDSTGVVKAVGTRVVVLGLHYTPNAAADDVVLQEYDSAAAVKPAIVLKAATATAEPIDIDFAVPRELNGLVVGTIDGGTLYLYVKTYISAN